MLSRPKQETDKQFAWDIPAARTLCKEEKYILMSTPKLPRMKGALVVVFAMCSFVFVDSAAAQFHIPGMPGGKKDKDQTQQQPPPDPSQMPQMPMPGQQRRQKNDQSQVKPPGVPVP